MCYFNAKNDNKMRLNNSLVSWISWTIYGAMPFLKINRNLVEQKLEATLGEIFAPQLLWKRIHCISLRKGGYRPYI